MTDDLHDAAHGGPAPAERAGAVVRQIVLTVGAVLGALALLAAGAAVAFDVKPLVFRSGSMGPAIQTGALGLAQQVPAVEIRVGDVVSVLDDRGTRITHRVTRIDGVAGDETARQLTLQGDANDVPDAVPYTVTSADRLLAHVNRVGYAVAWLSSPAAMFIGGLVAAWLLAQVFRRQPPSPHSGGARRGSRSARRSRTPEAAGLIVALVVGGSVAAGLRTSSTLAAFTDTAGATSGTFATASLVAPTNLDCTVSGGLVNQRATFTWTAPVGGPPPTSYLVTFTRGGSTQTASVTTTSWQFPTGQVDGTYTVRVQGVLGQWVSPSSNAVPVTKSTVVIFPQYSC